MLTRLSRLATGRPRAVLVAAVVFIALSAALGGGVAGNLTSGGFEDPSAESSRADELLDDRFATGPPTWSFWPLRLPAPRYQRDAADRGAALDVEVGGSAQALHEIGTTIEEDLPSRATARSCAPVTSYAPPWCAPCARPDAPSPSAP